MSVFAAIRTAILRAEGVTVREAYSSTDQVAIEMSDLANEVAADIASQHDWQALTKIHSLTGGAESYPLPADYDRMTFKADVDDASTWFWGYEPFDSVNDWMRYTSGHFQSTHPGGWIILGGELRFHPAPQSNAQFPYVSTQWARSESGDPKSVFDRDDDTFLLSERLLTLGLIWRWKAQKGLEYAEDMATYEQILAQEMARDRGSYVLRSPRGGRIGARVAYSGRAYP